MSSSSSNSLNSSSSQFRLTNTPNLSHDKIAKLNKEYREGIISTYHPMHGELYGMNPTSFFVPSLLNAINENTEEGFRNTISEPSPRILTFEMLQPEFCKLLLDEVENFENRCPETRTSFMQPNTLYGVVLDDFGPQTMLDRMMKDFILPMSTMMAADKNASNLCDGSQNVASFFILKPISMKDLKSIRDFGNQWKKKLAKGKIKISDYGYDNDHKDYIGNKLYEKNSKRKLEIIDDDDHDDSKNIAMKGRSLATKKNKVVGHLISMARLYKL